MLTLAVGALICVKSVLWTSEAGLVCCALLFGKAGVLGFQARVASSLDVGVLLVRCGAGVLGLWTNLLLLTVLSLGREGVVNPSGPVGVDAAVGSESFH